MPPPPVPKSAKKPKAKKKTTTKKKRANSDSDDEMYEAVESQKTPLRKGTRKRKVAVVNSDSD